MKNCFISEASLLYQKMYTWVDAYVKENPENNQPPIALPEEFKKEFFGFVDKVNLNLMEDKDNFYGYFLFQMGKEIRFDISNPTAINFKGAKYAIYFNPLIFLTLTPGQMESTIKHEILHIVSLHLLRAKEFKKTYSKLALNLAMDIVVNTYLDHLPPDAATLNWVNITYSLALLPFESFEYYAEKIQTDLDLRKVTTAPPTLNDDTAKTVSTAYDPTKTHDLWDESDSLDEQTLKKFTEKYIDASQKGPVANYLESMIASLKNSENQLSWNWYLKKLTGSVAYEQKKTTTRRNRRQPERLDLPGRLRNYKAKIFIALDISGSISDAEFKQAMQEVFHIVKNYHHEITIIECDSEVRRMYPVKSIRDIKDRLTIRGETKFTPVFEYANTKKINLLVYFTDGKGEDQLLIKPKSYKTLWVISGKGNVLSVKKPYGIVKKLTPLKPEKNEFDSVEVEQGGYSMNNQEKISLSFD